MQYTHNFFGYEINLLGLQAIAKPYLNYKINPHTVVIPLLFYDRSELSDFIIVELNNDEKFERGNAINKIGDNINPKEWYKLSNYVVYDRIDKGINELKSHWQNALSESINKQVNG